MTCGDGGGGGAVDGAVGGGADGAVGGGADGAVGVGGVAGFGGGLLQVIIFVLFEMVTLPVFVRS